MKVEEHSMTAIVATITITLTSENKINMSYPKDTALSILMLSKGLEMLSSLLREQERGKIVVPTIIPPII